VLILRDVLRWQAAEVAELLDSTVASVNSALQRAHATLESVQADDPDLAPQDDRTQALLQQYVAAFESYDVDLLVTLLRDDVAFSMPPFEVWLTGPAEVGRFLLGTGAGCRGSRLLATSANGTAAFGSYKPAGPDAAPGVTHEPWSIQVIEVTDDRISGFHSFLYPELFPAFGLPERLTDSDAPAVDSDA
jgi:RNA polymerase sigma-70 factor (ECF subfamily)